MQIQTASIKDIYQKFNTNEKGLSSQEAEERIVIHGSNELPKKKKDSLLKRILSSLADPMIIVLIVAAGIQIVVNLIEAKGKIELSDLAEVFIIFAVIIINTLISIVQDYKTENALEALQEMTAAKATVLRDGHISIIDQKCVVPGDILHIKAGDQIAADCRVVKSTDLQIEESALTGESNSVRKTADILNLDTKKPSILDLKNMIFSGTTVTAGSGIAVVFKTGKNTELGKIANTLAETKDNATPLQIKMAELSKILTKSIVFICLAYFIARFLWLLSVNN